MKFRVTDPSTGDKVVIEANSGKEAVEKYKASKASSPKDQSWLNKAGQWAKQFIEAPYRDEKGKPRRDVSLAKAAFEPILSTGTGLYGLAKTLASELLPPPMRPEPPSKTELLKEGAAALVALNPELIPILSAANVAGEATYGMTGSPMAGGLVNQILSLISPSAAARGAKAVTSRIMGTEAEAGKMAAKGARALSTASGAEHEAAEVTTQSAKGVAGAQAEADRLIEEAQTQLETANKSLERFGVQVPKAVKQIKPATAEVTPQQFGESFTRLADASEKVEPGIYQRGRNVLRRQAEDLYEAAKEGGEREVDTSTVAPALQDILKDRGIAVQIVPTRAETLTARTAKTMGALDEEEAAFNDVISNLSEAQQKALKEGGVVPMGGPGERMPYEVADVIVKYLTGKQQSGFAANVARMITGETAVELPEKVTVNDLIGLRQRVNGLKRVAAQAKNMDVARQYENLKNVIDQALPADAQEKLAIADKFYARRYIPTFGARSDLYKISQDDASKVFDSIVRKDQPERLQEVLSFIEPEEKAALQSAFHQRLVNDATDRFGFHGKDFVKTYDQYSDEVKRALLGTEKGAWDDVANFIANKSETIPQEIKRLQDQLQTTKKQSEEMIKIAEKRGGQAMAEAKTKAEAARKDADQIEKLIQQFKKPPEIGGGFIKSRARILPILAALDLIKYEMFGVGGSRLLAFALSDMATYGVLTNPQLMTQLQGVSRKAMKTVADVINTRVSDPAYLTKVTALENLLRAATQEKAGQQ